MAIGLGAPASAGVYSDDLSKCLVSSANDADRALLVKWIFSAMSASPAVSSMVKVTPDERHAITLQAGGLFTKLIAQTCRTQTVAALKYEGMGAVEAGFAVLGQVAVRGLMTEPAVATEMGSLGAAMDKTQLDAVTKEAGLPISK